jgi:hypothetical protein
MKICYVMYGTMLHADGDCAATSVEATSNISEQKLECWASVVEQFVFQYVTRIKSYRPFKLYFNL